jgi:hypothetical protein
MAASFKTGVFYLTTASWGSEYETAAYAECETTLLNGIIVRFSYLINDGMMASWWSLYSGLYLRYDWLHKRVEFIVVPDGDDPFVDHEWTMGERDDSWDELEEAAYAGDSECAFYALREVTSDYLRIGPLTPAARQRIAATIAEEDPLRDGLLDELIEKHGLHAFPPSDDEWVEDGTGAK